MKKLLSFLLSICLICVMIPAAHAAGSVSLRVSASSATVGRGDTITFTVSVSGSGAVTQYGLQLQYDSSVFEMVSGSHSVSGAQFAEFHPSRGFAVLYGSATVPSGTVGTFTLRVKDSAPFGSYTVGGNGSAKNGTEDVSASASGVTITVACKHSYGSWSKVDDNSHKHTCSICGKDESGGHNWDKGTTTTPATCQATGEALHTCTDCGATKTATVPLADHKYSAWSKVDDNKHTHSCSVCGKEETKDHTWESSVIKAANCISDGETKYTCTGCGISRTEKVAKNGIHTYDHGCDNDCNVCGEKRTTSHQYSNEWKSDKNGHWHACIHCGDKQAAVGHIPGPEPTDDVPQTCTDCGYILKPSLRHEHVYDDKLTGDETGHWYPCQQCTDQKDFAQHEFDNDCDTKCEACGYERAIEHKWGEAWSHDENGHFHACTVCGEKQDEAAHSFRQGVCNVCAAVDGEYKPMPTVLSMGIGAVIGAGITAAAFIVVGKKKKTAA